MLMTERISGELSLSKLEAAKRLRVSTRTVNRYIASGQIPFAKLPGGQIRIPASAVDAMLTPAIADGGDAA